MRATKRPPLPASIQPLGLQVRRLRLERNLSQQELADRAGLKDYKYIGRVELSKAEPGAEMLVRLAWGLGVSVGDLFDTITPISPKPDGVSRADVEALSVALKTLSSVVDRILARQPPPVPRRAPRRRR